MAFTLSMLEEFRSEGCQVTWWMQKVVSFGIYPVEGNLREICCKICNVRSMAGGDLKKKFKLKKNEKKNHLQSCHRGVWNKCAENF